MTPDGQRVDPSQTPPPRKAACPLDKVIIILDKIDDNTARTTSPINAVRIDAPSTARSPPIKHKPINEHDKPSAPPHRRVYPEEARLHLDLETLTYYPGDFDPDPDVRHVDRPSLQMVLQPHSPAHSIRSKLSHRSAHPLPNLTDRAEEAVESRRRKKRGRRIVLPDDE